MSSRVRFAMLVALGGASLFVALRFWGVQPLESGVQSADQYTPDVSPTQPMPVPVRDIPTVSTSRVVTDDDLDADDEVESAAPESSIPLPPTQTPPRIGTMAVQVSEQPSREDKSEPRDSAGDDARAIFSPLVEEGSRLSGDQFFSGVRVQTGSQAPAAVPTPEATPEDEGGLEWVEGQARGYAMLYAMQPSARPVVEQNVRALLTSHIKDVYIAVLIDGTFGQDFEYLRSLVTRLSANGRRLSLVLYLSNGATMRVWDSTPIDVLFTRLNPFAFRTRIVRERDLQAQFVDIVRKAKRIFAYNRGLSPFNSNVAIPMLEDNLDRDSYRLMRDLARGELGDFAQLMRNPCVGCITGNDGDSLGDPREEHTLKMFSSLRPGDGYSLDGIGFSYPGEVNTIELSADQLLNLMSDAYAKGLRHVGLWRHNWQGVKHGIPNDHPNERLYRPSSEDEIAFEIEVLRHRLSPVIDEGQEDN